MKEGDISENKGDTVRKKRVILVKRRVISSALVWPRPTDAWTNQKLVFSHLGCVLWRGYVMLLLY